MAWFINTVSELARTVNNQIMFSFVCSSGSSLVLRGPGHLASRSWGRWLVYLHGERHMYSRSHDELDLPIRLRDDALHVLVRLPGQGNPVPLQHLVTCKNTTGNQGQIRIAQKSSEAISGWACPATATEHRRNTTDGSESSGKDRPARNNHWSNHHCSAHTDSSYSANKLKFPSPVVNIPPQAPVLSPWLNRSRSESVFH